MKATEANLLDLMGVAKMQFVIPIVPANLLVECKRVRGALG